MSANEEVVMVLNPNTNKLVNVKPLFDLDGDFEEAYNNIDKAIYTIVVRCNFDEYGNAVKDTLFMYDNGSIIWLTLRHLCQQAGAALLQGFAQPHHLTHHDEYRGFAFERFGSLLQLA